MGLLLQFGNIIKDKGWEYDVGKQTEKITG